jgi:pyrimidine operon attenuation protein/uracil phosphoribosyltransferase
MTPPYGGVFVARTRVMEADDISRAGWRMAHEIIERNQGLERLVLIGLRDRLCRARARANSTAWPD